MLALNRDGHQIAAFLMALFGIYVFFREVKVNEFKVMDDGSLVDLSEKHLSSFKHAKPILVFKAGFDIYRSISFGISGFSLMLDLLIHSGHLTLPSVILAAGEIVNDFSDFCFAVVLISVYIGPYPAVAYGLTYLALLIVEVVVWLGTCKFHQTCRTLRYENKKKFQEIFDKKEKTNSAM